jgi:hypothetical protein
MWWLRRDRVECHARFAGRPGVPDIDWGVAASGGHVYSRSGVSVLVSLVGEVDGVVGVDGDLGWEVDDIIPPVGPMV